ncbi:unnamed protein product [Vitrella brassicaformis CCMP3155]|uniref:Uncharacterized protein n=1 Tax=Vitrella brassicaformis (strain CCMP3155) TaxID=1169540 RepID=A0A0G4GVP9_VITBC|nr:unnamed protein product [Vitrella brassicaformis CCMP3155]|eukprot:CEM34990.1 unnamed protein product [Vitrella brassicaformis CCMP3155]
MMIDPTPTTHAWTAGGPRGPSQVVNGVGGQPSPRASGAPEAQGDFPALSGSPASPDASDRIERLNSQGSAWSRGPSFLHHGNGEGEEGGGGGERAGQGVPAHSRSELYEMIRCVDRNEEDRLPYHDQINCEIHRPEGLRHRKDAGFLYQYTAPRDRDRGDRRGPGPRRERIEYDEGEHHEEHEGMDRDRDLRPSAWSRGPSFLHHGNGEGEEGGGGGERAGQGVVSYSRSELYELICCVDRDEEGRLPYHDQISCEIHRPEGLRHPKDAGFLYQYTAPKDRDRDDYRAGGGGVLAAAPTPAPAPASPQALEQPCSSASASAALYRMAPETAVPVSASQEPAEPPAAKDSPPPPVSRRQPAPAESPPVRHEGPKSQQQQQRQHRETAPTPSPAVPSGPPLEQPTSRHVGKGKRASGDQTGGTDGPHDRDERERPPTREKPQCRGKKRTSDAGKGSGPGGGDRRRDRERDKVKERDRKGGNHHHNHVSAPSGPSSSSAAPAPQAPPAAAAAAVLRPPKAEERLPSPPPTLRSATEPLDRADNSGQDNVGKEGASGGGGRRDDRESERVAAPHKAQRQQQQTTPTPTPALVVRMAPLPQHTTLPVPALMPQNPPFEAWTAVLVPLPHAEGGFTGWRRNTRSGEWELWERRGGRWEWDPVCGEWVRSAAGRWALWEVRSEAQDANTRLLSVLSSAAVAFDDAGAAIKRAAEEAGAWIATTMTQLFGCGGQ